MKKQILFIAIASISLSACDFVSDYHMTQSRAVMDCGNGVIVGHIPNTNIYDFYGKGFIGDFDKGVTPEQFCSRVNKKSLSLNKGN